MDPGNAGADPADPQTWNGYAYVGNNPLSVTDPSGEGWLTWLGIGLDIVGALLTGDPALGAAVGIGADAAGTAGAVLSGVGTLAQAGGIFGSLGFQDSGGSSANQIGDLGPTRTSPELKRRAGCPASQARFFGNVALYRSVATKAKTSVDFVMAISAEESGWNAQHSQDFHNLFGITHAGGDNVRFETYDQSATYWKDHYASWVSGAKTIESFVDALLNHKPPYNRNLYGDYRTLILGGTLSLRQFPGKKATPTPGTYNSVLKYEALCGVNPQ